MRRCILSLFQGSPRAVHRSLPVPKFPIWPFGCRRYHCLLRFYPPLCRAAKKYPLLSPSNCVSFSLPLVPFLQACRDNVFQGPEPLQLHPICGTNDRHHPCKPLQFSAALLPHRTLQPTHRRWPGFEHNRFAVPMLWLHHTGVPLHAFCPVCGTSLPGSGGTCAGN